jgi:hypothetical protein
VAEFLRQPGNAFNPKNTPDEKLYNPYPSCGITGFLRTICYDATGRQPQLPQRQGHPLIHRLHTHYTGLPPFPGR